jgi:hypothetical protein
VPELLLAERETASKLFLAVSDLTLMAVDSLNCNGLAVADAL